MSQTPDELTAYLHTQIPISLHMGVRILAIDELSIRIAAPLAPNINHRDTFFGGSISGMGILAGWTLLHLNLVRAGYQHRLVVQHSETDYQAPAETDVETTCALSSPDDWERFVRTLARRGKARMHVTAQAIVPPNVIAEHKLAYVAMLIES